MSVTPPSTGAVLAVMALLAVASPAPLSGQQDAPDPETERLTAFAKAHMAINGARDEFHGQVGRIHDEQGRQRARMELEEKIARTLMEHELTQEEYDQLILVISIDGDTRAAFEEILAQLVEAARIG